MNKKNNKYNQLHILYVSNCQRSVQTIIVKETNKLWTDVMYSLRSKHPEHFPGDINNFYRWGSLKKEDAYQIIHNNYWIMMYGPDFNELLKAWDNKFNLSTSPRIGAEQDFVEVVNLLNNKDIIL